MKYTYALPSTSAFEVTTIYKSTNGGANWAATTATPCFHQRTSLVLHGRCHRSQQCQQRDRWEAWIAINHQRRYKLDKISEWVGTTGQYVHADQQIIYLAQQQPGTGRLRWRCSLFCQWRNQFSDRSNQVCGSNNFIPAIHPNIHELLPAGAQITVHPNNAGMPGASVESNRRRWRFCAHRPEPGTISMGFLWQ